MFPSRGHKEGGASSLFNSFHPQLICERESGWPREGFVSTLFPFVFTPWFLLHPLQSLPMKPLIAVVWSLLSSCPPLPTVKVWLFLAFATLRGGRGQRTEWGGRMGASLGSPGTPALRWMLIFPPRWCSEGEMEPRAAGNY